MKKLLLLAVCAIALLSGAVSAQTTAKVQEHEFIGVFWYLKPQNGNLVALEAQTPESKMKIKALGFGGEALMLIKGEQLSVRFKSDKNLQFIVRVDSQQTDPVSIVQFFRFEAKKGMRQLSMTKVGSMATSSKSTANDNTISFNAAKYGESSFRIVPANALVPGEYCLSGPGNADGFCFGIDPVVSNK